MSLSYLFRCSNTDELSGKNIAHDSSVASGENFGSSKSGNGGGSGEIGTGQKRRRPRTGPAAARLRGKTRRRDLENPIGKDGGAVEKQALGVAARNPSTLTNSTGPARLQAKTQERTEGRIVGLPRRRRFGRHLNCRLWCAAGDEGQALARSQRTETGPAAAVRASTEPKTAHGGVLANPSADETGPAARLNNKTNPSTEQGSTLLKQDRIGARRRLQVRKQRHKSGGALWEPITLAHAS
jgi:hypothetical protein